jgi:hypothetical protein
LLNDLVVDLIDLLGRVGPGNLNRQVDAQLFSLGFRTGNAAPEEGGLPIVDAVEEVNVGGACNRPASATAAGATRRQARCDRYGNDGSYRCTSKVSSFRLH